MTVQPTKCDGTAVFDALESRVRVYCRDNPAVFVRARGARIWDECGRVHIDFLSGAGALNYGHNHPGIKRRMIEYLEADGILQSLDLHTAAKRDFLARFNVVVLAPGGLDYRVQFCGPTGANAVEAALKLARKVTARTPVVAFTNGYHGMSLGALAATAHADKRQAAGLPLHDIIRMPFDGFLGPDVDTLEYVVGMFERPGAGIEAPAAFLVETVQAEGGINVASARWLQGLQALARRLGSLLIVDEIQTGVGRTGPFFSFQRAGLQPDLVCVSKSISGYGGPMALLLIRPQYDIWAPGEHNGTFRGQGLAFVAACAALDHWTPPDAFPAMVAAKAGHVAARLAALRDRYPESGAVIRGVGLLQGIAWSDPGVAGRIAAAAASRGLIIETCGPKGEVLKLLPPLTITDEELDQGLDLLDESAAAVLEH